MKNSRKLIFTPSLSADSITMIFAMAPRIVALPARVEAEAKVSHSVWESAVCKRGNIRTV